MWFVWEARCAGYCKASQRKLCTSCVLGQITWLHKVHVKQWTPFFESLTTLSRIMCIIFSLGLVANFISNKIILWGARQAFGRPCSSASYGCALKCRGYPSPEGISNWVTLRIFCYSCRPENRHNMRPCQNGLRKMHFWSSMATLMWHCTSTVLDARSYTWLFRWPANQIKPVLPPKCSFIN